MQPGNVNLGLGALGIGSSRPQYTLVAKPDGGYDFFRVNYNLGRPVSSTKITREEYAAAGYQDPTQPQNINIQTKTDTGTTGQQTTTQQQPNVNPEQTALEKYMADQAKANAEAAAAAEAKKREDAAKAAESRSKITEVAAKIKEMYNSLFGKAEAKSSSDLSQLQTEYGTGLEELAKAYSQQVPAIGQAYAARGAYDSTWRAGAEQQAQTGYEKQLSDLAKAFKEKKGSIGSQYEQLKAGFTSGLQSNQAVLDRIASITDPNELANLRTNIEQQLIKLGESPSQLLTPEQGQAAAGVLPGLSDKFNQASKTIQTIIQGQAPAMLKKSIASQIVSTSDLTDQEKKQLQDQINAIA